MTFTLKTTKRNIHGAPRSVTPADYFTPGIGLPAKSTADYYNMGGMYAFCPNLDLDACGAAGAAVKAAHGGMRYPWFFSSNHPNFGYAWLDGVNLMLGFSNDPAIFPTAIRSILPLHATFSTPNHPAVNFALYEEPYVIYNPADVTGEPFWMYAEVGSDHWSALFTSADFETWTPIEIAHDHISQGWSSFQHVFDITPGAWRSVGLYGSSGAAARFGLWTSSDGITWTTPSVPIAGTFGVEDADGRQSYFGDVFETGGNTYVVCREDTTSTTNISNPQYVTIVQIDPATLDYPYPYTGVHIGASDYARYVPGSGFYVDSGPDYINDIRSYREDGILHIYVACGFAGEVNTHAGLNGPHGQPFHTNATGGGLVEEFVDYYAVIYDAAAAAQAAPCGVEASCNDGVVLINWDDTLPNQTYRLYRGSSAGSQTTLIRDVTGTFTVDNPPLDQMWYYKLVTLESGVERKYRVVRTYASSASNLINKHRTRVIDDGGA